MSTRRAEHVFLPPFSQCERPSRAVRPRRETSVGVWSRRPQLLRSFGTLHSGYSGRVKDSSFRARRAHDECRLSAEPLPIPPHGSILSQAPRRRSAPHRYPHRYPSIVSATARSLPRLLSATATPPCGGCNSTSAWSTTTEVPAKLKSSFLAWSCC